MHPTHRPRKEKELLSLFNYHTNTNELHAFESPLVCDGRNIDVMIVIIYLFRVLAGRPSIFSLYCKREREIEREKERESQSNYIKLK